MHILFQFFSRFILTAAGDRPDVMLLWVSLVRVPVSDYFFAFRLSPSHLSLTAAFGLISDTSPCSCGVFYLPAGVGFVGFKTG